jgi:Fe-S cluster assembly ATPase SufC
MNLHCGMCSVVFGENGSWTSTVACVVLFVSFYRMALGHGSAL